MIYDVNPSGCQRPTLPVPSIYQKPVLQMSRDRHWRHDLTRQLLIQYPWSSESRLCFLTANLVKMINSNVIGNLFPSLTVGRLSQIVVESQKFSFFTVDNTTAFGFVYWLFYILATSEVISGQVPTYDSAHS